MFYAFLCPGEKHFLSQNRKIITSDVFRTTSPHEDTVRMESNNNVAALLHRVNFQTTFLILKAKSIIATI